MWTCPKCQTENWDSASYCQRCDPDFHSEEVREQHGADVRDDSGYSIVFSGENLALDTFFYGAQPDNRKLLDHNPSVIHRGRQPDDSYSEESCIVFHHTDEDYMYRGIHTTVTDFALEFLRENFELLCRLAQHPDTERRILTVFGEAYPCRVDLSLEDMTLLQKLSLTLRVRPRTPPDHCSENT